MTIIKDAILAISELARQQALEGTEEKYNKLYKLRSDLNQYEKDHEEIIYALKELIQGNCCLCCEKCFKKTKDMLEQMGEY